MLTNPQPSQETPNPLQNQCIPRITDFDIALRMRDFEINQLAQRNNFFMIFQGVLFAGLVQSGHSKPIVSFMVCVAGFVISIFQIGMASGAKFWQEYWEEMLANFEAKLRSPSPVLFHANDTEYVDTVGNRLKKRGLCGPVTWLVMCRFSVSRIPIYVGLALSFIWALLVLCTFYGKAPGCILGF